MPDIFTIGHTTCDMLSMDDFLRLCTSWLESDSLHHVVTLNPEMVMFAEHSNSFRTAINSASVRVPDGAGLIWAHWYARSQFWSLLPSLVAFSFRTVERITGVDILMNLARAAEKNKQSVYLLGGTKVQVSRTARLLSRKFPELVVHTSVDHAFDIHGPQNILDDIIKKQPAILFAAYGAPNQSLWIEKHKHHLGSVRIAIGVGGAFAILSEENPRAPRFLRTLNLEWFWRLLLEPSRLPRIWQAVAGFPRLVHKQKQGGL